MPAGFFYVPGLHTVRQLSAGARSAASGEQLRNFAQLR